MKKILYAGRYNESNVYKGPEKVADRIYACASDEFETSFVTYFFDGKSSGLLKKLFGETSVNGKNNKSICRLGLIKAFFFAFKFRPDIIHIITFERFAVIFFLYKLFRKVKIIYNVHGIAVYEDNINPEASLALKSKDNYCEKIFFKYSDELVFLSDTSVKTASKFYNTGNLKISLIPNGIDRIFYETGKTRKPYTGSLLKVVFIGEVSKEEKGFAKLISELSNIEFRTEFRIELYSVSSVKPDEKVSGMINNIDNFTVHFIDKMNTEDYAEFLKDKHIYISPASYEQFSIAAVESMAAGLVPIVTAETGMSSYIDPGVNGYVYDSSDELTELLNKLISDARTLNEISSNAMKIYDKLNWDMVYQKYKLLYE